MPSLRQALATYINHDAEADELDNIQANKEIVWTENLLKSIEWKLFEDLCMEFLRIKNCDAKVTSTGADGGIDIKITDRNGIVFAIAQCKAWSKPVGVKPIRELYGIMAGERIKLGLFLTTSGFSEDARNFADGKSLILIDSREMVEAINQLAPNGRAKLDGLIRQNDYQTPTCVNCNTKMVKRTAKTGPNAGNGFWGCVNFPRCKNTMKVRKQFDASSTHQ